MINYDIRNIIFLYLGIAIITFQFRYICVASSDNRYFYRIMRRVCGHYCMYLTFTFRGKQMFIFSKKNTSCFYTTYIDVYKQMHTHTDAHTI